jgi:D-alanyl-D-alanine carboxypeptidase
MKQFWQFLLKHKNIKLGFIGAAVFLSLLPGRNFYNSLVLGEGRPVIRDINLKLPVPEDYPVNVNKVPAPLLSARAAVVIDAGSKSILYTKNADLKLLPASTTKIMTGLVALEHYDLNQVITIDSVHQTGQVMKLEPGEKIIVENLLYGLLVQSANDAATILAQNYPGGADKFIGAMNEKAKALGLDNTHFTNATGLDAYDHYTSAHDLALLGAAAMQDPTFKKIVGTRGISVNDTDNAITHDLETINELLGEVAGLSGIKTGWTELAGECFVSFVSRGEHDLVTVVLGSSDRFGETVSLIDWSYSHHRWQAVSPATR